jgi:phosphoribosylformylglycinamidine synthase
MENFTLGIWLAHGEGRFIKNNNDTNTNICAQYVDFNNKITMQYPYNPNYSYNSISALCSNNGRILISMPHMERSFLRWQHPYLSKQKFDNSSRYTSWIMLFKNAYDFCKNF